MSTQKKPSDICKDCGLDSLAELVLITGRPESTLIKWSKKQPDFFLIVVLGAVTKKNLKQ